MIEKVAVSYGCGCVVIYGPPWGEARKTQSRGMCFTCWKKAKRACAPEGASARRRKKEAENDG